MPEDLDIAVARYVRTAGLATQEQVTAAMEEQARLSSEGTPISLSDALLKLGFITRAQHSMVVQKARAKGGVQQFLHYKLLKKLGEGGMGAVYLADDTQKNRKVAVKVLPKKFNDDPELLKRFRREADAAFHLTHPNIVGAYALGEDLGYHFYVMEYCEGETLDATLKRDKQLPIARALDIVRQSSRGLKYAHDQGFIHRDIKPANIILTREGTARILDLGLSKNIEDAEGSFKTVSGAVLGTPHYIAPEQAQGEKNVDGRADLYSLGATFYHLITGQTPFDGKTILEILSKQVNAQLPNPQDLREEIPDGVVHVLRRMMAKDPADRYRDCGELIEDLDYLASGKTPATKVLDPNLSAIALVRKKAFPKRPTARRPAARSRSLAGLWIGLAGVLAIVAYGLSRGGSEPPKLPSIAERPPEPGKLSAIPTLKTINDPPAKDIVAKTAFGTPGLVGHWKFDEGKGDTAGDDSGHGHAAKIVNGSHWVAGQLGAALQFDGTENYVELPGTPLLDKLQEASYTVALWYKPLALPRETDSRDLGHAILVKPGAHTGLTLDSQGYLRMTHFFAGNGNTLARSGRIFGPGRFYHVAGVVDRDAGRIDLYVDGNREGSATFDKQLASRDYGRTPWRMGLMAPGSNAGRWSAKGVIDDARLYNRALSAAEIEALAKKP